MDLLLTLATFLVTVVTVLVGFLTAAVVYTRWNYGKLEKIPGLPAVHTPSIVGGSEVAIHTKIVHENDAKNVKRFGKIFGYYEGREAQIHVADPDVIKEIFIKDFDHFHNKRLLELGHPLINDMMDLLPYKKWKPVRNFLTPILSTGKIRNMSLPMADAIQDWMTTVRDKMDKNDGIFDPKRLFAALTSDVIARCGFGTKVNCLDDPNNPFVQNVNKMFHEDMPKNFLTPLIHSFPFLMKTFPMVPFEALEFFESLLQPVLDARRVSANKMGDFVDTLNDMMDRVEVDAEWKELGITKTTVISQAILFFMAAFRTTSAALTYFTYVVAAHPEVQAKLQEEVDAYLARNKGEVQHETLKDLVYMSACLQETLRMYPPVIRVERVCNKTWKHSASDLVIPVGTVVQVPLWSVHHSEDYYDNPEEFRPERFMSQADGGSGSKTNPNAFIGFGLGPHNCVGMRFAKEEVLMSMTQLIKNFTFKPNDSTKLHFFTGNTFTSAVANFTVSVESRL